MPSRQPIYFNEIESFAADWLGNLWPGASIDRRSIADVTGADLAGVERAHFFAGIGGWEYALSLAGWPYDRPVWTGSCPCQPFSAAGKGKGTDDARHLWPEFLRLIEIHRPPTVFGEQVASRLGRDWLAGVRTDLEALGYVVGAADLCAASLGAPHIRQRLYWVADLFQPRLEGYAGDGNDRDQPGRDDADTAGSAPASRDLGGLADTEDTGFPKRGNVGGLHQEAMEPSEGQVLGGTRHWANAAWLPCFDGKARRVEPGIFPLAHGVPARVGRLRAYGNAIVPQVAATFVRAFLACES